jgi:hypothetical protein
MEIYCLFCVANQYYQPNNDLVCFWSKPPTFAQIAIAIFGSEKITKTEQGFVGKILRREKAKHPKWHDDYRIETLKEAENTDAHKR